MIFFPNSQQILAKFTKFATIVTFLQKILPPKPRLGWESNWQHALCFQGDFRRIRRFVEVVDDLVDMNVQKSNVQYPGYSPLMCAVHAGSHDAVHFLIHIAGSKVNRKTFGLHSFIIAEIIDGHFECFLKVTVLTNLPFSNISTADPFELCLVLSLVSGAVTVYAIKSF